MRPCCGRAWCGTGLWLGVRGSIGSSCRVLCWCGWRLRRRSRPAANEPSARSPSTHAPTSEVFHIRVAKQVVIMLCCRLFFDRACAHHSPDGAQPRPILACRVVDPMRRVLVECHCRVDACLVSSVATLSVRWVVWVNGAAGSSALASSNAAWADPLGFFGSIVSRESGVGSSRHGTSNRRDDVIESLVSVCVTAVPSIVASGRWLVKPILSPQRVSTHAPRSQHRFAIPRVQAVFLHYACLGPECAACWEG